jgi:FkbM family methyltransferase
LVFSLSEYGVIEREFNKPWGFYAPRGISAMSMSLRSRIRSKRIKKRLVQWSLLPAVYDISRFGIKFRCYAEDNHTENSIISGAEGKSELESLLRELKAGDTFIDLGANCGVFSLTAAKRVGSRGRVLAIEPNPAMISRLRFNIEANALANVTIVEVAVGESDGEAKLHLCARQQGTSTLLVNDAWPTITVASKTLMSVCTEYGVTRIDALKIDIEGYEDRALLPFLRSAPKSLWPRAILLEVAHADVWREGCLYHLQDMGFQTKWRGKNDVLLTFGT